MSKCCFCGKEIEYKVNGNDPRPIRVKGKEMPICCNECNARIVVPTRVAVWGMEKELKDEIAEKDKEIALLEEQDGIYHNQLAIEALEKVKSKAMEQKDIGWTMRYKDRWDIIMDIDNQINVLRNNKDGIH